MATAAATLHSNRGVKGELTCDGKKVDSEIIYWRNVPGDAEYEIRSLPIMVSMTIAI